MKPQKALSLGGDVWKSAGLGSSFTPTCQTSFNIKQVGSFARSSISPGEGVLPLPRLQDWGVPSQAEAGWGPHI